MTFTVFYVLGCESCGKTSLIQQLESMSRGSLMLQPIKTFPTTGQCVTHCTLKESLVGANSHPSFASTSPSGSNNFPVRKKNEGIEAEIEIRELGGSMEPHWEKFLQSSVKLGVNNEDVTNSKGWQSPTCYALLYVIDAVAIHQLCQASNHFLRLTESSGLCKKWPTLLLLHKCNAPSAISVKDLRLFFGNFSPHVIHIIEVDAWTGYGIGDAFNWMQKTVVSNAQVVE